MSELDRIRERLRQNRAARRQTIADGPRGMQADSGSIAPGTLKAGDRVFDLFSGEEGDVVTITRAHLIVPTAER